MGKITEWINRSKRLGLKIKAVIFVVALSFMSIVTEIFGIGMFLPIFQFIETNGDIESLELNSNIWVYTLRLLNFLNLEPKLATLLLLTFSLFLIRQLVTYLRLIYNSKIRLHLARNIRNLMFSKYLKSNSSYHDSMPVGSLVNVMTTEVNYAVNGIMAPIELIVHLIMLFGYLAVLLLISWEATISSIILLILSVQIPNIWIKKSANVGRSAVKANTLMSKFLLERIQSPRLVRLANSEEAEQNGFKKLTENQFKFSYSNSLLLAKTEVTFEPIIIGIALLILYFAVSMVNPPIEIIGIYVLVALRLIPMTKASMKQWHSIQRFLGAIEIVDTRIKEMKKNLEKDYGKIHINDVEKIEFDKVDFAYTSSDINVLNDITFEIHKGDMMAIVGPSGSGKSTLIDLLPGLRRASSGSIKINGLNTDKYTLSSLRQAIAYVPQDPQIFDESIKNHISYGKKDATDQEIVIAAQMSGAHEFISSLPNGYDTEVGENATKLSGGQRQRIDIARALLCDSSILILDEPTSSIDIESERWFLATIEKIRQSREIIIFIVTHNVQSIQNSDRILVLNNGKIESIGTHKELITGDSWYTKVQNSQN